MHSRLEEGFYWDYFHPKTTELPVTIQICCARAHGIPRIIAIGKGLRRVHISISETPAVIRYPAYSISPEHLDILMKWVAKHKNVLLGYWNGEFDAVDFMGKMGWR